MENPNFHLEGIVKVKEEFEDFEGPLSLILMLLSKNKIEIRSIKISEITDQYLAYLAEMKTLDLEIASEFVQMASHLVYLKTKTLLAGTQEVDELEELISALEQMKARENFIAIQQVAPVFSNFLEKGYGLFSTPGETIAPYGEYNYEHKTWELVSAILGMVTREEPEEQEVTRFTIPKPIIYSARKKSFQIIGLLKEGKNISLNTLYSSASGKSEVIATFISVLELCSNGNIVLEKNKQDYIVRYLGGEAEELTEVIDE